MSDHTLTFPKRKNEVISGVYMFTCLANGKRYIGSSYNIYKRLGEHIGHLVRQDHGNHYLQEAWDLYGEYAFNIEILEECAPNMRNAKEKELILALAPEWNLKLPNVEKDTWTVSEETRKRISEAGKGRVFSEEHRRRKSEAQVGRRLSEETKAKIAAAHTGKKLSDEHKRKVSEAGKGRTMPQDARDRISKANKGKKFTAEHLANLSAAHKGYVPSEETKRKLSEKFKGRERTPDAIAKGKATLSKNKQRKLEELQGRLF